MRIIEREVPMYAFTPMPEISSPPTMDFKKAKYAKRQGANLVRQITGAKRFASAELAVSLALYNNNLPGFSSEPNPQLISQLEDLAQEEAFMETNFPLIPPLGIELESPMGPLYSQTKIHNLPYHDFFSAIGMPQNRDSGGTNSFWEFSPKPAYSHRVISRILSELVQGGFVPSLTSVQQTDCRGNIIPRLGLDEAETKKIQTLLQKKLLSLHINLGIPEGIQFGINFKKDAVRLGALFALAYTSPLRLESRMKDTIAGRVEALPTAKSSILRERLEMKPFELRDASVYKLLEQIQLISTSFFAHYTINGPAELSTLWESFRDETQRFWDTTTSMAMGEKEEKDLLLARSKDREGSTELRSILHKYTAEIRKPLLRNVPLPKTPDASILLPICPNLRDATSLS